MKVEDLIAALQKANPEVEIAFCKAEVSFIHSYEMLQIFRNQQWTNAGEGK